MPDFGPLFEQPPRRVSLNTSLGRGGLSLEEKKARYEDPNSYGARQIQARIDARDADLRTQSVKGVIEDRAAAREKENREQSQLNKAKQFGSTVFDVGGIYADNKGLLGAMLYPANHKENIAAGNLGETELGMIEYAYGMIAGQHPDSALRDTYSKRQLADMNRRFEEHHDDLLDSGPTTTGFGGSLFSARDHRGRPIGSTVGLTEGDLIKSLREKPLADADGNTVHPALFAMWYRLRMASENNDRGLEAHWNVPDPDPSAIFLGARKDREEGLPLAHADRAPGAAKIKRSRRFPAGWDPKGQDLYLGPDNHPLGVPLKRFVTREGRSVESEASKAFKAQGGIDPEIPWFQRTFLAKSGRESDDDWLERISNIR